MLASQGQVQLLIDDEAARRVGRSMGLKTLGTLGVLTAAYREGLLTADMLDAALVTIETRDDIWGDADLCRRVRREVLGQ